MKKTEFRYDGNDLNAYMTLPLYALKFNDFIDEFYFTFELLNNGKVEYENEITIQTYHYIDDIFDDISSYVDDIMIEYTKSIDYSNGIELYSYIYVDIHNLITRTNEKKKMAHITINFYR